MFKGAILKIAAVIAVGMTFHAGAHNHDLCEGFVPQNDMKIPVGANVLWDLSANPLGLTEEQFNNVLDRVERLYTSEIQKAGGTFSVNRRWSDATVNASAQQMGTSWVINMYGGLARHPAIGVEGFALVACHEIGHHIGGAPKGSGWWGTSWATNEGGSDYFAGLKCLRVFFAEDDNEAILATKQVDPFAKARCEQQFTNYNDQLICMRTSLAGDQVAMLFQDLRKEATRSKFDTPDTKVVTKMYDAHPATQCRLDTYFNSATCNVSHTIPVSQTDYREGSCVQGTHDIGWRPLCWFKPD